MKKGLFKLEVMTSRIYLFYIFALGVSLITSCTKDTPIDNTLDEEQEEEKQENVNSEWIKIASKSYLGANSNYNTIDFSFANKSCGFFYYSEFISPSSKTNVFIKKTLNEGQTWEGIYGKNLWGSIPWIRSFNEDTCYAILNYEGNLWLLKTIDGGDNWNDTLYVDNNLLSDAVINLNNDLFIVIGGYYGSNKIIKIKNNEKFILYESDSIDLSNSKISFPTEQDGYVIAKRDSGTIILLSTHNAGINWQEDYEFDDITINHLYFKNENTGYLACNNGVIYITKDRGKAWTKITTPTTQHLNYMQFINDSSAYCVGNSGTLLYSSDGANWIIKKTEIKEKLTKIQMFDTISGYIMSSESLYRRNYNN